MLWDGAVYCSVEARCTGQAVARGGGAPGRCGQQTRGSAREQGLNLPVERGDGTWWFRRLQR